MEKIREKSGNFVSPEEWEQCISVSKGTLKKLPGWFYTKIVGKLRFLTVIIT